VIEVDMDLDKLRMNKAESALALYAEGRSVRSIALLLYDDASEAAQGRVRALISKFRRKMLQNLRSKSKPQPKPKPKPLGSKPKPKLKDENEYDDSKHAKKEVESNPCVTKEAETVEKGKASDTVLNWLDENMLAKQLADECYEAARKLRQNKDYQNTFRFMELVTRFLKLSQSARKEYDLEEARRELAELRQRMQADKNGVS
jgi:hypothetical protein